MNVAPQASISHHTAGYRLAAHPSVSAQNDADDGDAPTQGTEIDPPTNAPRDKISRTGGPLTLILYTI